MQDFRNLRVWQKGHQLAINAYALPAYLTGTERLAAARPDSQGCDFDSVEYR